MTHQRTAAPTRRRVLAGATAVGVLALAPAVVRAQARSLKIAVLLTRSGYLAPGGQSCHRGALIAPQVLADYGHQVDLVHVDVESNPDVARNRCERVINDGADVVVGAFDSACTLAIAQVCEQRQVPLVVNIAGAPALTEQATGFWCAISRPAASLPLTGLPASKLLSKPPRRRRRRRSSSMPTTPSAPPSGKPWIACCRPPACRSVCSSRSSTIRAPRTFPSR
jgi:ABC-type branched-subunit amino acid transport system substrate-binding protein